MASATYIKKKRERASKRGKYGNEVKRRMMIERCSGLDVVGGFKTWGSMGEHEVELLACDDPTHVWILVDGLLRTPRTMNGVHRVLSRWVYNKRRTNDKA